MENEWNSLYEGRTKLIREIYERADIARKIGILSSLERLTLTFEPSLSELPYKSILSETQHPIKDENDKYKIARTAKLQKNFKSILQKLRKDRGVTMEEVAKAINVHARTISRYELEDIQKPHFNQIKALAVYYNVPLNAFYEE